MPDSAFADLCVPLEGSLVRLEPLSREHEAGLWEAAQDSDWSWMPVDAGASRDALRQALDALLHEASDERRASFATVRRADGRVVGGTSYLEIRPEHARVEIGGTWLARSAWRTGINVEAKLLQLEHAFSLGYQRVEFKTHPDNARSRGALAALPARFEGILRKHMLVRDGVPRDSAYYSVVDDEWPEVREILRRRLQAAAADDRVQQP